MAKIDRLGWAAGLSFVSYGVRVGVRVNDAQVLNRLSNHLPPGWKPASSPVVGKLFSLFVGGVGPRSSVRRFNLLYGDIEQLSRTLDVGEVFETLESNIRLYVAERAQHRLFVHAGVVGWRGQAVIIPGRSFSGKTTLVAEMVKAGATYYSDEFAILDKRGHVHPFPKPLSIREEGSHKQHDHPVETLGGKSGVAPLPVKLVVCGEFKAGASWRPRELSAGQGVLEMLSNTVAARLNPEKALDTLQRVTSRARVLKGARGEAREVAASILKVLDN
ncbi:MAG: hypothetical protein QOH63_3331 [Acidobacteriota bacterium]|jgi:hypothetical protein|nr:hypothetical protein [Acidobacteriota bacterium]